MGGGQNKIIGINFFGASGIRYLSVESWRKIITHLARNFRHYYFVIMTSPTRKIDDFHLENVFVFENNSDLLNLVAMTKRLNLLISVDTGNVHIADNLQIPTLGLYTKKMFKRWRGGTYGGKFWGFVIKDNATEDKFLKMAMEVCQSC